MYKSQTKPKDEKKSATYSPQNMVLIVFNWWYLKPRTRRKVLLAWFSRFQHSSKDISLLCFYLPSGHESFFFLSALFSVCCLTQIYVNKPRWSFILRNTKEGRKEGTMEFTLTTAMTLDTSQDYITTNPVQWGFCVNACVFPWVVSLHLLMDILCMRGGWWVSGWCVTAGAWTEREGKHVRDVC